MSNFQLSEHCSIIVTSYYTLFFICFSSFTPSPLSFLTHSPSLSASPSLSLPFSLLGLACSYSIKLDPLSPTQKSVPSPCPASRYRLKSDGVLGRPENYLRLPLSSCASK